MMKSMAIEFTLTRVTANQIGSGGPSVDDGSSFARFRVVVEGLDHVRAYLRTQNSFNEEIWSPLENDGFHVGRLVVYRRVAIAIAMHMLIARLRDGIKGFEGDAARIVEMPNGAAIIDLGEV